MTLSYIIMDCVDALRRVKQQPSISTQSSPHQSIPELSHAQIILIRSRQMSNITDLKIDASPGNLEIWVWVCLLYTVTLKDIIY